MSTRRFATSTHALAAGAVLWIAIGGGLVARPVLGQTIVSKQAEDCQPGKFCVGKGAELAVPLCPGGNIAYFVEVENLTALTGTVQILDPIPAGTTFVQGSASNGATYEAANDRIVWNGPLAPGQSWTIGFSVTVDPGVPSPSTITNVATGTLIAGETPPLQGQVSIDVQVNCPPLALAVEKTAEFAQPLQCPGGNVFWEVRFTNLSDRPKVLTAEVKDTIPAGLTLAGSLPEGCGYEEGTRLLTCNGVDGNGIPIGPGQTKSVGFSTTVDAGASPEDTFTNTATVTLSDPQVGDSLEKEAEEAVTCPEPPLELDVEKTAEFAEPLECPGGNVFWSVRFTNSSDRPSVLTAAVDDLVPAGMTFAGSLTEGCAYNAGTRRVTCNGIPIGPGQTKSIGFSTTVDAGASPADTFTNTATVTLSDPVEEDSIQAQATETVACRPPLDLDVEKTAHFAEPLQCPGGNVFFEVRFANRSDRETVLDARLEDPIPDGATLIQASLSEGAVYDPATDTVTWEGPLGPGETDAIGFSVVLDETAGSLGTITNEATVTLSDPEVGDSVQERASESVSCPEGPIGLSKESFPDSPLCPGSFIHYDVLLTNPAGNERALEASIEDPIPANTSFVPGSILGGARFDEAANAIVWEGTLEPGESKFIGFSVKVDPGVPNGTVITNTARGVLTDPETGELLEAEAESADTVDCEGEEELAIELHKTSSPDDPLCPGSTIDYEVVLTNPEANGRPLLATLLDRLPINTTFVKGSVNRPGLAVVFAGRIFWFGTLDPGESVTLEFTVKVGDVLPGTKIVNRALGVLSDPLTDEEVGTTDETEDEVDDCDDGGGCRLEVSGFVEDSIGNGQGRPYPVSNARVWLLDIQDDPLPIAPLSERKYAPMAEDGTNRTFETGLEDEEFPLPGRARYGFDVIRKAPALCPPRTVVVSALWDADDRFAVAPRNPLGGRYVPAYLARCISDEPDEVLPDGPCFEWRLQGAAFVPWDPEADVEAEVRFTYGSSPSNGESVRVVHDPDTANPPLSESWDLGTGLPPDFFFQDAAHMYFFSYKAMEHLTGLAGEVRNALAEIAEEEDEEPKGLALSPVLITPHDRDCPSGCAWSAPQLADDPLAPLPGRLPLDFGGLHGGLHDGGATVVAGALVAFDDSHSSSRFLGAPFPDTGDKPDNREWHELGHWWMLQLYDGDWPGAYRNDTADCREEPPAMPPVPPGHGDGNHCGYANRSTTDSYIEGFAELTSLLIADQYEDPQPALYHFRGSDRNLEVDHQVWGPYTAVLSDGEATALELLDPRDEDFAVAGILWDLYDPGTTTGTATEPKAPGVASDAIRTEDRSEEEAAEIFARIRHELPEDLAELFGTLTSAFPGDSDGDGFGDVEELFIAHGAFADAERDLRHDPGEIPGDTGSSKLPARPLRLSREPVPNGFLDFDIVLAGGFPFASFGFPLDLRYEFDPPFDHYDHERTLRSRGRLYLNMPPPLYQPCRLTITARGSDAIADLRSDPLVITCAEYWDAIQAGALSVGEHTFVLEAEKPPEPPADSWLTSPELPGFEAQVRITPAGGEPVAGAAEPFCIVESLCVSGALPGRPEIFIKVIGPRPNGKLWTQISRFTPSEVEVWLRQVATGTIRYYRLGPVGPFSDDVSGLQDREAFDPAGAPSTVPRGALLPGAAVEPLPLLSLPSALGPRLEPGEPEPPEGLDWLTTAELPGFRFKALITPAGGQGVGGQGVDLCIPETLCIQGALAGRPEVFAKIIGPRPNGFLWVQAARFTPSRVELWVEQEASGTLRYYRLEPVGPSADDVSGLQDREAFTP